MLHLVVAGLAPLLVAPLGEGGDTGPPRICAPSAACLRATATAASTRASSQRSASFEARLATARAQVRHGRHEQAIPLLKELLAEDAQSAEAHMLLGVAFRTRASPEILGDAQAELRQALALDPQLHWARFALARIYIDLGRYGRAREELEEGLKGLPDHPLFLSFLAEVHRLRGDPQRALQLAGRASRLAPGLSLARLHLARASLDLDRPDEALRQLEPALHAEPMLPEVLHTLGALYLRVGKPQDATQVLERAIELDPSSGQGRVELARAYLHQNEADRALDQLERVFPNGSQMLSSPYFQELEAEVYFLTGEANRMKGRGDEARRAYRRAIEIDPAHQEARRRLADPHSSSRDQKRPQ
ncbi:MAG: tetratricopeptide repeat protein [Vicinamibacteraceae bacterium]